MEFSHASFSPRTILSTRAQMAILHDGTKSTARRLYWPVVELHGGHVRGSELSLGWYGK